MGPWCPPGQDGTGWDKTQAGKYSGLCPALFNNPFASGAVLRPKTQLANLSPSHGCGLHGVGCCLLPAGAHPPATPLISQTDTACAWPSSLAANSLMHSEASVLQVIIFETDGGLCLRRLSSLIKQRGVGRGGKPLSTMGLHRAADVFLSPATEDPEMGELGGENVAHSPPCFLQTHFARIFFNIYK